jgi:hypothetical protein
MIVHCRDGSDEDEDRCRSNEPNAVGHGLPKTFHSKIELKYQVEFKKKT